jgi:hypothetical protein
MARWRASQPDGLTSKGDGDGTFPAGKCNGCLDAPWFELCGVRVFPCVMFGEAPLKVVGMASVEFVGRCYPFENICVKPGNQKRWPAIRSSELPTQTPAFARWATEDGGGGGNRILTSRFLLFRNNVF